MNNNSVFSERLQALMTERGVTQVRLCELTGLSSAQANYLANGRTKDPKLSTACKIALALDVSLDYLGGLIDEPKPIERDEQGNIAVAESLIRRQMQDSLSKLNDEGQMKAADYVRDLTELDRYTERKNASAGDSVQEVAE